MPIVVLLKVSRVQEIDSSDGLIESTKELFVAAFNVELMEAWGHFSEDLLYNIKELWENKQLSENFWSVCSKNSINPSLNRPLSSVHFSRSVVSNSATPLTAARQASLSTINSWSFSNLSPLSQWCHPSISCSVISFSYLQFFPASGSFQMSQFFTSGGQILEFQLQHQSFQWIFKIDFL